MQRDVYLVSGLFRYAIGEYGRRKMRHPMPLAGTLGLAALNWFPSVTYDLIAQASEDGELHAGYDADGRLVAWGKRWVPGPCDPGR